MPPAGSALQLVDGGWKDKIRDMKAEEVAEALVELESFLMEDIGWRRVSGETEFEFSAQGLMEIIRFSRFMFLKNPLINHAVLVQTNYTWGKGASFTAQGTVGQVVEGILGDPKNLVSFTSHQQQMLQDIQQAVDGNLFISMFTNPSTGRVIFRMIPVEEIIGQGEIIRNPNDKYEPWYYKRVWQESTFNPETGISTPTSRTAYYPDWRYDPTIKPVTIGRDNWPVFWDAPIYHIKTGGLASMMYGVPEMYSALDWAKAVKDDMEAYMALRKALMRYAWLLTVRGDKKGVSAARRRLGTTATLESPTDTNAPAGPAATFITSLESGNKLEPFRTSGSAPSPDEGRRVGLMVAAGTGIPETILFGDADVGNLATAETLDRPTELQMANRQQLWADVYKDILGYCIEQNVLAPNGRLSGSIDIDEFGRKLITLNETDESGDPIKPDVNTQFPDILAQSVGTRITAIVDAATLLGRSPAGTMPDKTLVELLLRALDVEDVNKILEDLFPDGATSLPTSAEVVAGDAGAQPGEANFTRQQQQPQVVQGDPTGAPPPPTLEEAAQELKEALARAMRPTEFQERDFSQGQRDAAAKKGSALPDGWT